MRKEESKAKQSRAISLRSGMTPPTTSQEQRVRGALTEKVFPSRGTLGPVEERRSVGSRIEQTG
jgi:hypothetical protein